MELVLEMPLRHRRPPQPEPEVRSLWKKVEVFYTVVDFDKKKPMYAAIVPHDLTVENDNGSLVVDGVVFGPDAWRIWTEKEYYESEYQGRRRG